ncbi:MAG: hypothetical protein FRX49_01964 [Trebouxia sp. A1-2]|nr:MAG: hypothetical protein FRX49_01964 [Trebouxia sp. A1-2]
MHASLLAYGRDLSVADLVRPAHIIFKLVVRQGELHCLLDLLFLNVIASNILSARQRVTLKCLDASYTGRSVDKSPPPTEPPSL